MRELRLWPVCGVWPLLVLGCASSAVRQHSVAVAKRDDLRLQLPKVRIVDPQLAAARSARSETVTVPFGVNQNGTELVYALLERAGQAGARYVADLKMLMGFRWRGTAVECRTAIMLEGDPRLTAAPASDETADGGGMYQTDVTSYQPQQVDFVAEDRELVCRKVTVPVNKWRRVRDIDRSAETVRLEGRDPDSHELVTEIGERDRCEWKAVTRATIRYDYEVKLGFVPPNWDHLQTRFARRKLVPTKPTCYVLSEVELTKQPLYRITATAYHRGKVAQRLPGTSAAMKMGTPKHEHRAQDRAQELPKEDCG